MSPDRYRELLLVAARTYNVPPAPLPLEEMWSRIQRERHVSPADTPAPLELVPADAGRVRARAPQFRRTARRFSVAPRVDAGGRGTRDRRRWWTIAPTTIAAAVALFAFVALQPGGDGASSGGQTPGQYQLSDATPGWRNIQLPAAGGFAFAGFSPALGEHWAITDDPAFEAFRRAAIAHLKRSEILITSFNSSGAENATNRQTRGAVRELLAHTRLLISSPVAARTQYRQVFQDLELVLMKMSLVSLDTYAVDREQIATTLERRRLLPRIRELIPVNTSANAN